MVGRERPRSWWMAASLKQTGRLPTLMVPVYLTRVKPCAVHSAGRQGEGAHQGRGCQPSRCGKGKHPKLPQDVSSSPNHLYWHEPTVDHVWPQLAAGKLSPPEKGQPPTSAGVALPASRGHTPHGLATCTTAVALGRSETAVKRSPRRPPTPLPCVRGALVTVRGSEKNHPQKEETGDEGPARNTKRRRPQKRKTRRSKERAQNLVPGRRHGRPLTTNAFPPGGASPPVADEAPP